MKEIKTYDQVFVVRTGEDGKPINVSFQDAGIIPSCLLCPEGPAKYRITDTVTKRGFDLCEDHRACYDEAAGDFRPEVKALMTGVPPAPKQDVYIDAVKKADDAAKAKV